MFDWWVWLLIWAVLIVGGAAVCGWLAWRAWGSFRALLRETSQVSAMVAAVEAETRTPNVPSEREPEPLAVFERPADVAQRRNELKANSRTERQRRRAAQRPGWARSVD